MLPRSMQCPEDLPCMHMQVTVDLPDGRSIALPVSETTRGENVASYVAALLGWDLDNLRLWPADGGNALGGYEQPLPGTRFHAKLRSPYAGRLAGC